MTKTANGKDREPDFFCGAKTAKGFCAQRAGHNTDHPGVGRCSRHGGNTKSHQEKHARDAAVVELKHGFGREVDIDPHEAILLCIRITAGELEVATMKVNELEQDELLVRHQEEHLRPLNLGKDGEDTGVEVTEVKKLRLELSAWVKVRHECQDRLVRYASAALKAGLEERMVRIAESQGEMLAAAVKGILTELGVVDDPRAPQIVRKHLTQIAQHAGE